MNNSDHRQHSDVCVCVCFQLVRFLFARAV
jgi:hypothetical protein